MTTSTLEAPPTRNAATAARPVRARRSNILTLAMLALLVYFLIPLFWLVVAATKTTGDLFSTFGLWSTSKPRQAFDNSRRSHRPAPISCSNSCAATTRHESIWSATSSMAGG